ncbi:SART-1 protein [Corchorus olitorius]|uniref:SART-1 protein n=1 Tax=Corchorus olitorius TaxID=93759 RepID=A0A1R3JUL0_9ROSI|nr:SART-1 protein [Corchorus olitorius]
MGRDRYDSDGSRGNWDGGSYSEELEMKQNDKYHDLAKKKNKEKSEIKKNQENQDKQEESVHLHHDHLAGLDKVMDGGAVVLTLKDQTILVNGDINEDVDVLENIEIGEQKQRDEAYKAAIAKKKSTGVYDYNFHDEYDPTKNRAIREEAAKSEAEKRNRAYQLAYAKEVEASNKSLQVFADDEDDLYKSLDRARKLALKKQEEEKSGPQAIAFLSTSQTEEDHQRLVISEMKEFVMGLQLGNGSENEAGQRKQVIDASPDEKPVNDDDDKDEIVADETMHEVAVGKGLSGALKLLKDRGTVKEWGDSDGNMDNKKRKVVGIENDDRFKDIRIERTDEFGRTMTQKEAFKMDSHKFHGKNPGKRKQEKRMKKYQEELKLKQMNSSDTPSLSVERMKEAQIQLKTPYLLL